MIWKTFTYLLVLALGLVAGAAIYARLATRMAAKPAERKILYYVDPMHPAYKSDKPGVAPDCGMKLEPVYADSQAPQAMPPMPAEAMPPGTVLIPLEKQQLIGVRYGEVGEASLSRTIRAVGKVAYDETRVVHVHTRYEGWIDQITADFTGQFVRKKQPLFTIYSPELLATQQEFLLAAKARKELGASPVKEVAAGSEALYEAARKRLELWDITEGQIQVVLQRNKPIRTMTVFSPISGYILTKNAFPNQRITPDTEVYSIADLSNVWVVAELYEYEATSVNLGQHARVTLTSYPGATLRGTVSYIYPQVDNTTRTLRVRIDLENPSLRLKPDMFANVEFGVDYGRQLAVPEEAVLDSGAGATVFVDRGNGYLEPRQVKLGEKVDQSYIVLGGLRKGERVVTSGNFLVDSESRLKAGAASMAGMPGMPEKKEPQSPPSSRREHQHD